MPGYLLDTNAVIYFFDGEEKVSSLVLNPDNQVAVSFISKIELLCFETEDADILTNIAQFLTEIEIHYLDDEILSTAIEYRKKLKLKVPDAIIAATAKRHNMTLITADKALIQKIGDLQIITPI